MATVRVNGVTLCYEEYGAGPPILGIHGTGSSARLWEGAVPELSARGRLILYDRRGGGRSERGAGSGRTGVGQHADDAYALLRELDALPAVMVGRSYGGEVALELARRCPSVATALILLEPAIPALSASMRLWWRAVTGRINHIARADGPGVAAECFAREMLGDDGWKELPAEIHELFRSNGPAVLAEINGDWTVPDAASLAGLTLPTLLISADDSPAAFRAADRALAEILPRVRHERVPGGHLVDPAGPAVLAFLDDVLTTTTS
ncbi:alpha/beta hydrolase [Actinoplanes sp. NBC_00393]|uniref:alpha/beta fold hydrolase n=1 Tax=Actinoplanes sp. NBC_00393 TaxID=2975953 RepID=UPI002E23803A